MADITFNISKGKTAYYAGLPNGGDTLTALLLETSGIEADAAMNNRTTITDVKAGSTEQTDGSYSRKTLTSVSTSIDNTNDWVICTGTIPTWTALAVTAAANSKLVISYKPSGGSDSTSIPLTAHDFVITPDGTDVTATVPASGFCKIT